MGSECDGLVAVKYLGCSYVIIKDPVLSTLNSIRASLPLLWHTNEGLMWRLDIKFLLMGFDSMYAFSPLNFRSNDVTKVLISGTAIAVSCDLCLK